jgi:glucose uptake protein GlcU
MLGFPPEWLVFGPRRVIRVPAWLHSRPVGWLSHTLMAFLSVILFFVRDGSYLWVRIIIAFLIGFLYAFGWSCYFQHRRLVVNKKKHIDTGYMLTHLFLEYMFLFGILTFPFFQFDSLWCISGALLFHTLDMAIYSKKSLS